VTANVVDETKTYDRKINFFFFSKEEGEFEGPVEELLKEEKNHFGWNLCQITAPSVYM